MEKEPSQIPPSQHQNQAHPKANKLQCPDAPSHFFNKTETQHCSLADSLPKAIPNPETPQNLLLDMTLPFSETISSSVDQNRGTSPPNQETFTRHGSNPTHGRQIPQLRKTMTLQSSERRSQTQQMKQNEKAEKYPADEGTM